MRKLLLAVLILVSACARKPLPSKSVELYRRPTERTDAIIPTVVFVVVLGVGAVIILNKHNKNN